jgi:hypothetical protein
MKLTGNTDIEDSLQRLDKSTQEEARMGSAELLKVTHSVDGRVKGVEGKVQDVHSDVRDVRDDVQDIGNKVQGVDNRVQGIGSEVRVVDDKLDQANRSLYLQYLLIVPRAQTIFQGTTSKIIFYDGFRPQIHPSIIMSHAKLTTTVQLGGFSKAVYSNNGNPLTPSCGYTGNVGYSWPSP